MDLATKDALASSELQQFLSWIRPDWEYGPCPVSSHLCDMHNNGRNDVVREPVMELRINIELPYGLTLDMERIRALFVDYKIIPYRPNQKYPELNCGDILRVTIAEGELQKFMLNHLFNNGIKK